MARKCKQCSDQIPSFTDSETFHHKKKFCSLDCAAIWGLANKSKGEKVKSQHERKGLRERKAKLKTLAQLVTETQEHVNRLVVAEDQSKGCISCGSHEVSDAGHFFHKGSKYKTDWLTLFRLNLNGQCQSCNRFKGGGNQYEYQKGFIARYSEDKFKELEEFKMATDRGEVPKLTVEDCKRIAAEAREKLKELKAAALAKCD